jgi:hypothetical protein
MNNRVNQAILIFAIVIVIVWNYMRYVSTKRIEKYEMDKTEILNHISSSSKLDSVLVMTAAAKLTEDEGIIQEAYNLAESENRESLLGLFEDL